MCPQSGPVDCVNIARECCQHEKKVVRRISVMAKTKDHEEPSMDNMKRLLKLWINDQTHYCMTKNMFCYL